MISKKYPASEFIKMAMEEKEWSAKDLSERSNINLKTISLLLNNKTPFTVKMDYLIGPALGFSVGILSSIEAQYLEWKNLQESNIDNINIEIFNFMFRKHNNVNEKKLKTTIIKAEKIIRELVDYKDNLDWDLDNYFYNEYLYNIQEINDNLSFNRFLNKLLKNKKIHIFLFDNVNIRGMSKNNNSNFCIFINKSLNKTIDSFIITLTHELLHYVHLKTNKIEIKHKFESEKEEKMIDHQALNLMLNDQLDLIKDNDLYNVELDDIKQYSKNLNINWIYLFGLKSYINKSFNERNNIDEIKINYGDDIWKNKNI